MVREMIRRNHLLRAAACLSAAVFVGGCAAGRPALLTRIDASLASAGRFLVSRQSADGAWRSDVYGFFKGGPPLTPHVMSTLLFLPQAGAQATHAFHKGVDYLAGFVGDDGRLKVAERELLFPIYTAGSASRVVVLEERTPRNARAHRAWMEYVRGRQLNERLGWTAADPQYGGWGFSLEPPRKPADGQLRERFFESNLPATIFGLAALRSARAPADDPAYRQALIFVERCQNFAPDAARADPNLDDGGFFFMPGDLVQNKAGLAGVDRFGRQRFASYGTMTADGLRAMVCCGLPADHPRVVAARRWLERNFSPAQNPGRFAADREVIRDGVYYYWAWAVGHALLALGVEEIETPAGKVRWAEQLADELLRRQRPDGAWINRFTDAREDDPLVATPFAASALAICRTILTGQYKALARRCPVGGLKPGDR
jgi:squalene-hopene/tetraprenyl-beta-curcumene cyclase